uniref:Uncharacterized protein n=1 Tax=Brugia malayi TaxID=6279 RepID=A0A912H0Q1_BRUMA
MTHHIRYCNIYKITIYAMYHLNKKCLQRQKTFTVRRFIWFRSFLSFEENNVLRSILSISTV